MENGSNKMNLQIEKLVKTWDVKTTRKTITDRKNMIADRKRDGINADRWANDLKVLQAELAAR